MAVYFIRHGQSQFNAVFNQREDPMIFDAPLSEAGIAQAKEARDKIRSLGIRQVISSPLTRAIQTAQIMFDGLAPIRVQSGHHEYLLHSCDVGRSPSQLAEDFPTLGFDHLERFWWHHETGDEGEIAVEPKEIFKDRIDRFVAGLDSLTDFPVAIVGHGNAFKEITGTMMQNCEISKYR